MDETTNDIIIIVNFDVIVKKNNHTLVSDEDRKMPILGSTDSAGNSGNLVSGIIRLLSGLDFSDSRRIPLNENAWLLIKKISTIERKN